MLSRKNSENGIYFRETLLTNLLYGIIIRAGSSENGIERRWVKLDMVRYPNLIGEMAIRNITKKSVAQSIGVCDKAFGNKLKGKTQFTWPEVKTICHTFFPGLEPDYLFATADDMKKER